MGDVGWEGGIRVEGDVKGMDVGVRWEVEHGFDCEFRSREEITSGGEGWCEHGNARRHTPMKRIDHSRLVTMD